MNTNPFYKYVSRMALFTPTDWVVYVVWVGLMLGLFSVVTGFLLVSYLRGVNFPIYVWNIPIGILIFSFAIAVDTIGHRTVYKQALIQSGEQLVHHVTIFAGITSVLLLCLAYHHPAFFRFPVWVMAFLSVFFSFIDEAMHWVRYAKGNSDPVEMWSHFFIFVGHLLMIATWVYWFEQGYPGVEVALKALYGG